MKTPPHLRLYDGTWCKVQLQLELRDIWIGLFWRKTSFWHFYMCVVPCLPLHIIWVPRALRRLERKTNGKDETES